VPYALSMTSPDRTATRTLLPSPEICRRIRVGLFVFGSITANAMLTREYRPPFVVPDKV